MSEVVPSGSPGGGGMGRSVRVPGFLNLGAAWKRLAFANGAVRREAKAILFQELAVATAHGMPLNEALRYCMRTEGERLSLGGYEDASNRWNWTQRALAPLYVLTANLMGIVLLLFLSGRSVDVERVARVLALRLLPLVEGGHDLSSAMALNHNDFSKEEVQTIAAGEHWNRVPEALDRLGKFQVFERELQRHWARMAYPALLFSLLGAVISFVAVFIVPEYKNIYDQLGAELPGITHVFVDVGNGLQGFGFSMVLWILGLMVWFFLVRLFMVGNRVLRLMAALYVVAWVGWMFLALGSERFESADTPLEVFVYLAAVMLSLLLAALISVRVLGWAEKLVLWGENKAGDVFGKVPIFGAPRRAENEARWLGALSLALVAGADAPGALEDAGAICGGRMGYETKQAAELARGGYSIGEAVLKTGVLREELGHRLNLLEGRADYLQGLQEISDDAADESYRVMTKSARVAEVVTVCLMGAAVAGVALALYIPLFGISDIVGVEY